jgi:hypothetical protein
MRAKEPESLEQRLFRSMMVLPKVKFTKPDCAFCRGSKVVREMAGWVFVCKLGYMPACADSCPDFDDARKNRGFA